MHYHVSESYLAERRGGPRRACVSAVLVVLLLAFLAYSQHGRAGLDDMAAPLLCAAVMMAAILFFVIRRMQTMTRELENWRVGVTAGGIVVEARSGPFTLEASGIRKITMYRTVLGPKRTYFVIAGDHGEGALPPFDNPDGFAQDIQAAFPTIPLLRKRKLFAVLGA